MPVAADDFKLPFVSKCLLLCRDSTMPVPECKVGPVDEHVLCYCLRNAPQKALYHPGHPGHVAAKAAAYASAGIAKTEEE